MPSHQQESDVLTLSNQTRYSDSGESIDVLLLVRFLWNSRIIISFCIGCGVVLATLAWLINRNKFQESSDWRGQWTFAVDSFGAAKFDSAVYSLIFSGYLKTPEGSTAFYEGINNALVQGNSLPVGEWATRQMRGDGIIESIEDKDIRTVFVIQNHLGWRDSQMQEILPSAINYTVKKYNGAILETNQELSRQIFDREVRMQNIRLKLIKLFESMSGLTPDLQNTVIAVVSQSTIKDFSPGTLAPLIAAAAEKPDLWQALVKEYGENFEAWETLIAQKSTFAKYLGVEKLLKLPEVSGMSELNRFHAAGSTLTQLLSRLPIMIIVGFFAGLFIGSLFVLLRAFFRNFLTRWHELRKAA